MYKLEEKSLENDSFPMMSFNTFDILAHIDTK